MLLLNFQIRMFRRQLLEKVEILSQKNAKKSDMLIKMELPLRKPETLMQRKSFMLQLREVSTELLGTRYCAPSFVIPDLGLKQE